MLLPLIRSRTRAAIVRVLVDARSPMCAEQIAALSGVRLWVVTHNIERLLYALYIHSPHEDYYELTPEGRVYCVRLDGRVYGRRRTTT